MDTDFWLQRWRDGQTGFHQDEVMPLLQKHWPVLQLPKAARVLVPLCGKTLDMHPIRPGNRISCRSSAAASPLRCNRSARTGH
ncbi:hypothetical protein [Pectobacterium brasiliense]|uniref:hypothetical protein n=1 Tax=Pectobacterium brasiliense TaxID=180957 RepID=UPI00333FE7ED